MPQTKLEPIKTFFESEFQRLLAKPSNRQEPQAPQNEYPNQLEMDQAIEQALTRAEEQLLAYRNGMLEQNYAQRRRQPYDLCPVCLDQDPNCPGRSFY